MNQARDTQIIPHALKKSISDTFQTLAGCSATVESVLVEEANFGSERGILAVLGLKEHSFTGSLAIFFSEPIFVAVMNKVLGDTQTKICPANSDGAAEFLNIIYASARVTINEQGFSFEPAIPALVSGEGLTIPGGVSGKVLKLSCRCDYGPFLVILSLTPKS